MKDREKYYIPVEGQLIEVTKEIYETYYYHRRKEKYFMYEMKAGRVRIDKETGEKKFLPSLEDSYDRLLESDKQFDDKWVNVEDQILWKLTLEKLYAALHTLSEEEAEIIRCLYYECIGETDLAKQYGIPRTTLKSRKKKILNKLKDLME